MTEFKNLNMDGFDEDELSKLVPRMTQRTDLIMERVPSFCPKCAEIRGNFEGGTNMINTAQTLAWKSFGMCELCYMFQRDNPEQAQKNIQTFKEKKEKDDLLKISKMNEHRFRVYLIDEGKFPVSPYASIVADIQFTKYPSTTNKGQACHTLKFLTEEQAKRIVEILIEKEIECWFDDSDYQKQLI